jgi:hypothetical protein
MKLVEDPLVEGLMGKELQMIYDNLLALLKLSETCT